MFVFMLLAHLAIGGQTVGIAFAAGGSDGGATETNGGERYLELESMTVTIFRNDAPAGQLTTRLTVLVPSSEAYATVKDGRHKLRDAMFRELLRMVEREARNGPVVDLDLVKKTNVESIPPTIWCRQRRRYIRAGIHSPRRLNTKISATERHSAQP